MPLVAQIYVCFIGLCLVGSAACLAWTAIEQVRDSMHQRRVQKLKGWR